MEHISNTTPQVPQHFIVNIGTTIFDKLNYVQAIKNAMAAAIMNQVAADTMDADSEEFGILQTFYLEASCLEKELKKL